MAEEATRYEQQAQVEDGEAKPRDWLQNLRGSGVDLELSGSVELAYDDNVFRYSDADQGVFNRNDSTRQTQFRHVHHIDDIVTVPSVRVGLKKIFIRDRPTEVLFGTKMHIYGSNTVKNYEEYECDLRQRLGRDLIGRVGYSYTPEFVLRNLFDTDQPAGQEYQLATYSKHALATSLWHRFTPIVRTRVAYEVEFKDYNHFFNERDHTTHTWDVTGYFHFTDWLTWRASYEIGHSDARASDDDADVDPDLSYFQQGFGTRVDVELLKDLTVQPFYTFALRNFTTDQSSTDDRLHRDREDTRQSVGIRATYELRKHNEIYFRWERHLNHADVAFATGVRGDTDVLGYDQNVFTAGITCSL